METIYGQEVDSSTVICSINRLQGQVFKLLPAFEEREDWIKPLETIIIELSGMSSLFPNQEKIFKLVCKLEGLLAAGNDIEFMLFRRQIFEACSLLTEIKEKCL